MDTHTIINLADDTWGDDRLLRRLDRVSRLRALAGPVVALPDVHLKNRMEAPSSLATAAEGAVIPDLSSCSLNCGMGLLAAPIEASDARPAQLAEFFATFRQTALSDEWDLSDAELLQVAQGGAAPVLRKYGFSDADAARIENGGKLGELASADAARLLDSPIKNVADRWKRGLGLAIGGNHFIEVQRVRAVRDPALASKWGIRPHQLVVMYHGGGGPVAGFVGRFFANRSKDDLRRRIRLFFHKVRYHFGDVDGLMALPDRLKYFSPQLFASMAEDSKEGHRLIQSMVVGMNYGYAYRMAMASRIVHSLGKAFGPAVGASLVYDSSHNSIQQETLSGRRVWVHRHNSCKVEPGQPLLVPGHYYSSSYLAVGAEQAEQFLNSAPHGLGELVSMDHKTQAGQASGAATLVFKGWAPESSEVPHMHSPRYERAFDKMEASALLKRVVDLEPIAVLKQFRGGNAWRQRQGGK
jgi:tRNA-splicing ligase RtcB (3'-phosphate/5'-hydroxy nucleic acid ligase)